MNATRRSQRSVFGELFAERQVYLRSRLGCRYVVLSRPLMVGVTLAMMVLVGSIASIAVGAVTTHLEGRAQARELARLEGVNRSLLTAIDAAGGQEALQRAAERLPALNAELASAQAARARALELADASKAEVDELKRELTVAADQIDDLERALERVKAADEASPLLGMGGAEPTEIPAQFQEAVAEPGP